MTYLNEVKARKCHGVSTHKSRVFLAYASNIFNDDNSNHNCINTFSAVPLTCLIVFIERTLETGIQESQYRPPLRLTIFSAIC